MACREQRGLSSHAPPPWQWVLSQALLLSGVCSTVCCCVTSWQFPTTTSGEMLTGPREYGKPSLVTIWPCSSGQLLSGGGSEGPVLQARKQGEPRVGERLCLQST